MPEANVDGWLIGECWLPVNQLYSMKPVGEMGSKVLTHYKHCPAYAVATICTASVVC